MFDARLRFPQPRQRRPIVLTVDDNPAMHEVYALAFEQSYDHRRAHGGIEALRMVQSERLDAMVLDLLMPDLNGFEVLQRTRKLQPVLIILISSVVNASRSALGTIRQGAADYFVKPTEPDVIEMVLRQLLAGRDDLTIVTPREALIARRVLIVGLDPGFRAALAVALQPRCRVDVAARISEAIEMLSTMLPDLVIVDLRSASMERILSLHSLKAHLPERPIIVVGSVERVGPVLRSAVGQTEILIAEPVDFTALFKEIGTFLPPNGDGVPLKELSAVSSSAVGHVVARYADYTLRVGHLSAGTGLSADHFAHVFSAEMGLPPMDYVVRVRTQAAIFALRETHDKVTTIARRFGFYDGPHLALKFRRRGLGKPTDFRPRGPKPDDPGPRACRPAPTGVARLQDR